MTKVDEKLIKNYGTTEYGILARVTAELARLRATYNTGPRMNIPTYARFRELETCLLTLEKLRATSRGG